MPDVVLSFERSGRHWIIDTPVDVLCLEPETPALLNWRSRVLAQSREFEQLSSPPPDNSVSTPTIEYNSTDCYSQDESDCFFFYPTLFELDAHMVNGCFLPDHSAQSARILHTSATSYDSSVLHIPSVSVPSSIPSSHNSFILDYFDAHSILSTCRHTPLPVLSTCCASPSTPCEGDDPFEEARDSVCIYTSSKRSRNISSHLPSAQAPSIPAVAAKRRRRSSSSGATNTGFCLPTPAELSNAMYAFLLLHLQLAHLSYSLIYDALRNGTLQGFPYSWRSIDLAKLPPCEIDYLTKSTAHRKSGYERPRATGPGQLFHSDLKGPFRTRSIHGKRYFMTFVDDYSGYVFVFPLAHKSDALRHGLKAFVTNHIRPRGINSFALQFDRGGEYMGTDFQEYCIDAQIEVLPIPSKTPHYNGKAERMNRTLSQKERASRRFGGLPKYLWDEVLSSCAHMHNISPTATSSESPYFRWFGHHPSVENLHVIGAECYLHDVEYSSSSQDDTAERVRFVGYVPHSKSTFILYRPSTGSLTYSPHVQFIDRPLKLVSPYRIHRLDHDDSDSDIEFHDDDDALRYEEYLTEEATTARAASGDWPSSRTRSLTSKTLQPTLSHRGLDQPPILPDRDCDGNRDSQGQASTAARSQPSTTSTGQNEPHVSSSSTSRAVPLRRSQRTRNPVDRLLFYLSLCCSVFEPSCIPSSVDQSSWNHLPHDDMVFAIFDEPTSVAQALRDPDASLWRAAMLEELEGLDLGGTWTVVDIPESANLMKTKWVFKKKTDKDGNVTRHRARLCVKGYTQSHGVDYNEVFAPVVRHSTLRIVLALAAHYGMFVHQLDVPKAFPQSDIDYDCYISAPPGSPKLPRGKCYKLNKALYGLKQAGRLFNRMLTSFLLGLGFTQSLSDPCLFYNKHNGSFTIICIYVDDILIASTDETMLNDYITKLRERFQTNDMGVVEHFLGMRVYTSPDRHTIQLSHAVYVDNILAAADMNPDHISSTPVPMHPKCILTKPKDMSDTERTLLQQFPYRKLVGMLMYLMITCRPDIAFAVCTLARFSDNFDSTHREALLYLLRYLHGTRDLRITYSRVTNELPVITGYCDADWAAYDLDSRKSHTGYVFMLSGGPIAWKSKLQTSLALSSMESEYYAMGDSSKEGVQLRSTIHALPLPGQTDDPTVIHADNTSAISSATNPVFTNRTKHIALRHHFIRQLVEDQILSFQFIPSSLNLADLFTKPLHKNLFVPFRKTIMGPFQSFLS